MGDGRYQVGGCRRLYEKVEMEVEANEKRREGTGFVLSITVLLSSP